MLMQLTLGSPTQQYHSHTRHKAAFNIYKKGRFDDSALTNSQRVIESIVSFPNRLHLSSHFI